MKEDHLSQRLLCLLALILMTALPGWTGAEVKADNSLFIDPVVGHVGKTVYIPVSLDNTDEVVAAQFDVTLPFAMPNDGVITMTNRQNGHAVSSRISGKTVTVLLSSMENKAIRGNSGILLRIPMTTYDDGHTDQPYAITVSNIVLTNSKGDNIATEKTSESTFTVSKEDCPDLTVEKVSVTTSESSLLPGKNASFSYTVKNSGTGATQAGWSAAVYLESEITGLLGTATTVDINPNEIVVERKGVLNSKMVFRTGEKSSFLYDTQFGAATLGVDTRKINAVFDDNGGELSIDYVVNMEHAVVSRNKLNMSVKLRS